MDYRRLLTGPEFPIINSKRDDEGVLLLFDAQMGLILRYEDAVRLQQALNEYLAMGQEQIDCLHNKSVNAYENYLTQKKALRPSSRDTSGYVYLIREMNEGHFKIGLTSNPEDRLNHFSVKLPFKVEHTCLIETGDMYTLEAQLHDRFADKRVDGEWFALEPEDVAYIKALAEGGEA